jgi:hypothetical protein
LNEYKQLVLFLYAALLHFSSLFGGVIDSVLATGPKCCGFDSGQGDGFLKAMKIRSTPSFRMESKAGGPMS